MMRSPRLATDATSGSFVNVDTRTPASVTNVSPTTAKNMTLYRHACQTDASARSGLPAPRFWPTSVAAALASPHAGRRAKSTMRIAIVYPASAALPNDARMRISATQLVVTMSDCSTALPDNRTMFSMTTGSRVLRPSPYNVTSDHWDTTRVEARGERSVMQLVLGGHTCARAE